MISLPKRRLTSHPFVTFPLQLPKPVLQVEMTQEPEAHVADLTFGAAAQLLEQEPQSLALFITSVCRKHLQAEHHSHHGGNLSEFQCGITSPLSQREIRRHRSSFLKA